MKSIYLDHAATTPVHPQVLDKMVKVYQNTFGNPSSIHKYGREARHVVEEARAAIAKSIGAQPKEIIFTSGGTEADNMAILGSAYACEKKGRHIITSQIEHHAVLHTCKYLEKEGFEVTYLPVDHNGRIRIEDFAQSLREDTVLVTIMYGNNEVGTLQPIEEIADLCREKEIVFHTDAVQAFGALSINVKEVPISLLSFTAHKINGPKGIGCLYIREGTRLLSQFHGGSQERKRRAGTENVPGIVGMQEAVRLAVNERKERTEHEARLKQAFLETLNKSEVNYEVNGDKDQALPHIVNIYLPGTYVESLLVNLDLAGVAVSSGSACTAGSIEPSHVLSAMYGSDDARAKSSIRISFGLNNTIEEVREAAEILARIVKLK